MHSVGGLVVEFDHGPATYLFDTDPEGGTDRTLLAWARTTDPLSSRDFAYQAGFPMRPTGSRPMDRGHYIPYSGGGLYGPNLFAQDRALNRGWSRQGRSYRQLETRATAAHATLFCRPHYDDDTDCPAFLDLGVLSEDIALEVRRFRNRYDVVPHASEDLLGVTLDGATSAQIGALGEETALHHLTEHCDATIITAGDAGMSRDGALQDLDIVASLDGQLTAFEVKARYLSHTAGRMTRSGNLYRPRTRRPASGAAPRQASQAYVRQRLSSIVDTGSGYAGIAVRVIAVDFVAMCIQLFAVNDRGTAVRPIGQPVDCRDSAERALQTVLDHRGFL